MAQLIKLRDYITRYEVDIYRYPSQFIRLKKQQWQTFQDRQIQGNEATDKTVLLQNQEMKESKSKLTALLKSFRKKTEMEDHARDMETTKMEMDIEDWNLSLLNRIQSPEERKQSFLNAIYPIQLKWASSTIREMSYLQKSDKRQKALKFFLQRFPDTFLVMYKPIFLVKQAPVELEIILITPTDIYALYFIEEEKNSVILGNNERFWSIREKENERKIVNPTINLNRMGSIIKNILSKNELEVPIKKILLHQIGYIDLLEGPADVTVIDKRNYSKWFEAMRANKTPLKHNQLKAAGALLSHCQSTYVDRPEWK